MTAMLTLALVQVLALEPCGRPGSVSVEVAGLTPEVEATLLEDLTAEALPPGRALCRGPAGDQLVVDARSGSIRLRVQLGSEVAVRSLPWSPGDETLVVSMLAGELMREVLSRPPPAMTTAPLPEPSPAPEPKRGSVGVAAVVMGSMVGDWFAGPQLSVRWANDAWGLEGDAGWVWTPARAASSGPVWSSAFVAALRGLRVLLHRGAFSLAVAAGARAGVMRGASPVLVAWEPWASLEGGLGATLDVGALRFSAGALVGAAVRGVRWFDQTEPAGGMGGLTGSLSVGVGWPW